jgi:enamine deaminase RidA (YjgF/YER057c/UK114 family)
MRMVKRYDRPGEGHPLYAEAVQHGDTLYLAGVAPLDEAHQVVGGQDAGKQADAVFAIIKEILSAHGADFADVLKMTVYLQNIEDRAAVARSRERWFAGARPASTLVEVSRLGLPDMLLEVDVIAALDTSGKG